MVGGHCFLQDTAQPSPDHGHQPVASAGCRDPLPLCSLGERQHGLWCDPRQLSSGDTLSGVSIAALQGPSVHPGPSRPRRGSGCTRRHPVSSLLSQPHLVCEPDQGRRLGWPPANLQGSAQPGTGEKQGLGRKPERKLSSLLTAFPGEALENPHGS